MFKIRRLYSYRYKAISWSELARTVFWLREPISFSSAKKYPTSFSLQKMPNQNFFPVLDQIPTKLG